MVTGSSSPSGRHDVEAVLKPDPLRFVGRLLGWIICWPWDLFWALCMQNPFRYLFGFAVQEVRAALDEITSGEFREIEQDLCIDPPAVVAASRIAAPETAVVGDRQALPKQAAAVAPVKASVAPAPMTSLYPTDDPWYAAASPTAARDSAETSYSGLWTQHDVGSRNRPSAN